jgi:hypothetical protein
MQHLNFSSLLGSGTIIIGGVSAVEVLGQVAISWHHYSYDLDLTNEVDLAVEAISGFIKPNTRTTEQILEHMGSIAYRLLLDPKADYSPELRERLKQVQAAAFPKAGEESR